MGPKIALRIGSRIHLHDGIHVIVGLGRDEPRTVTLCHVPLCERPAGQPVEIPARLLECLFAIGEATLLRDPPPVLVPAARLPGRTRIPARPKLAAAA
jgi:hypothetical protein